MTLNFIFAVWARTFDPEYPTMITNWERSQRQGERSDGESPEVHILDPADDAESALFAGLLEPSTLGKIRPWFRTTTYRFIPPPLSYIFIAGIPLVIPALSVAAGTFAYQKAASAIRVRRYLKHAKLDNNDEGSCVREDDSDMDHFVNPYTENRNTDDLATYLPLVLDQR